MFDVANYPRGLGSLLNVKQGGATPGLLNDVVAPILDLMPLYLLNSFEGVTLEDTVPAAGTNTMVHSGTGLPATVPAGEVWYVHGAYAFITVAAATAIKFTLGTRWAGLPAYWDAPGTWTAGEIALQPAPGVTGRWLPSGTEIVAFVSSITGAPGTLFANLVISRFRG